jgi:hypothetical protein
MDGSTVLIKEFTLSYFGDDFSLLPDGGRTPVTHPLHAVYQMYNQHTAARITPNVAPIKALCWSEEEVEPNVHAVKLSLVFPKTGRWLLQAMEELLKSPEVCVSYI